MGTAPRTICGGASKGLCIYSKLTNNKNGNSLFFEADKYIKNGIFQKSCKIKADAYGAAGLYSGSHVEIGGTVLINVSNTAESKQMELSVEKGAEVQCTSSGNAESWSRLVITIL